MRKNTKTYKEFTRLLKNLKEQSRYYAKRGVSLPSAGDMFTNADASAKNLRELKKFKTAFQTRVKQVKQEVVNISKELNVSVSTGYSIFSAKENKEKNGPVSYADVAIATFRDKISQFATKSSRMNMYRIVNEFENRTDKETLARVLSETAEQDAAFEELVHYNKPDVEAQYISELFHNMLGRISDMPLTRDEISDAINIF